MSIIKYALSKIEWQTFKKLLKLLKNCFTKHCFSKLPWKSWNDFDFFYVVYILSELFKYVLEN